MPVVTSARVGSFVGTGVLAREKLRIPAAASAKPRRIRERAMIQWRRAILGTGNGKGSRRSEARPSRRAARKRRGGRAMTPAVPVSFTCCPAGSLDMHCSRRYWRAEIHLDNDNYGVILQLDNYAVNWRNWYSKKRNGDDGVGTTQDRGRPKDRGGPNR
jgi:hypothetical protein